jgi:hypothetical protein
MHHQPRQHTTTGRVVGSLVTIATLVLVAALFGAGAAATAHAAPLRQSAPQATSQPSFGVPHEISKTTLNESSIDGPPSGPGVSP